jgi:hypothetical protein
MAKVNARTQLPVRRRQRHRPLLPLPPRRRTRRDGGRVDIYRRRRSGDDVPPLLRCPKRVGCFGYSTDFLKKGDST